MSDHEIYKRRRGSNYGLAGVMLGLVVMLAVISFIKIGPATVKEAAKVQKQMADPE